MPNQKTLDKILSRIKRGDSFADIGAELGHSKHTVRYWTQQARVADPKKWAAAFRGSGRPATELGLSDKELKACVKKEGIKGVAERLGVGRGVVARRLSR